MFIIVRIENPLVSIIIPSYNRFKYLLNAIKSVTVEKDFLNFISGFRQLPKMNGYAPDYDCWLGLLRLTNCDYINEPLFYYDSLHGACRAWGD
jgi:hypothetical protein